MNGKNLNLDIDDSQFRKRLVFLLDNGRQDLQSIILSLVKEGIARTLDIYVQSGLCIGYKFKEGNQSDILSIKSALDSQGFDFWYLTIQMDMQLGIIFKESSILIPKIMEWLPISYGFGDIRQFQFKHINMKTRERYIIKILHPLVPSVLFNQIPSKFECKKYCENKYLSPVPLGIYEWWQPFLCIICEKKYFCSCFKNAIVKYTLSLKNLPQNQKGTLIHSFLKTTEQAHYRSNICHLCTGTPSTLFYCHPMYGSRIKVIYGAYIQKTSIEKSISERDAENEVREYIGVPRIGEGWVSETQLYKLIVNLFAEYEVIREASPDWLGNQRLDIYIPSLNIAIEYQGEQHFKPIAIFGGEEGLSNTRKRDKRKKELCQKNKVKLILFKYNENLGQKNVERKLSALIYS